MKTIFHFHLIIVSSLLLSVDSCQNKKSTTATSTATTQQQTTTTTSSSSPTPNNTSSTTPTSTSPEDDNVRLVVSFYSIGEGIDEKLNEEFVKFLVSYPKKIVYEKKQWGREGEVDYCIAVKELQDYEQEEFVRNAKKILSTNVNVDENVACSRKKSNAPSEEKYRLIISFFSIGEGINMKANEEFEKFLSSYSPKVKHELATWGREGEKDYCFKLTELSTIQQEEFVRKAKEVATKKVNIKENEKCAH